MSSPNASSCIDPNTAGFIHCSLRLMGGGGLNSERGLDSEIINHFIHCRAYLSVCLLFPPSHAPPSYQYFDIAIHSFFLEE